jgi:hypothetical protein
MLMFGSMAFGQTKDAVTIYNNSSEYNKVSRECSGKLTVSVGNSFVIEYDFCNSSGSIISANANNFATGGSLEGSTLVLNATSSNASITFKKDVILALDSGKKLLIKAGTYGASPSNKGGCCIVLIPDLINIDPPPINH